MTYTVEQLKDQWTRPDWKSKLSPGSLGDATAIIPELIAELEVRDREIERLKAEREVYAETIEGLQSDSHKPIYPGDLAKFLDGKAEHEGVPVCRSIDEQMAAGWRPHLAVYPNGNVMFFYAPDCGVQWNPNVPLAQQMPHVDK